MGVEKWRVADQFKEKIDLKQQRGCWEIGVRKWAFETQNKIILTKISENYSWSGKNEEQSGC